MSWNMRFYKYNWLETKWKAIQGIRLDDLGVRSGQGDLDCMVALGVAHYAQQQYSEALSQFSIAAEQGNTDAMVALGILHHRGHGVKESEAEATRWFRLAAMKQNATAVLYMGFQLAGFPKDFAEAMQWLRSAATLGSTDAMLMIGHSYMGQDSRRYEGSQMRDTTEGFRWYRMAAENGNTDAMKELGLCYELGEVVGVDHEEALRWYMLAAGAGNVPAMILLGLLYDAGYDEQQAKSGEGSDTESTDMLHTFRRRLKTSYWDAMGPEYDFNRDAYDPTSDGFASHWALTWLHRAANSGDAFSTDATFLIGNIYQRRRDYSRAAEWYRKARDWDSFSLIGLGTLYLTGKGVDKDFYEAMRLFTKAHENWMGERMGVTAEGAIAPVLIGLMHGLGLGTSPDIDGAERWLGVGHESRIVPNSASWMSSLLYADRFYCEALYWLLQTAAIGVPNELVGLFEVRRSDLEAKLSSQKKREIEHRISAPSAIAGN